MKVLLVLSLAAGFCCCTIPAPAQGVAALTLFIYYLYGYTLNRVTLFALIFSIGILVDDPIVDVENIVRHYHLPENRGRSLLAVTVEAVNEVRSPLILATLAVIFAIMPMAFVRGLMGPYMRPIPVGASTAMLFSMAVAFVITPWAAYRLLPARGDPAAARQPTWLSRLCPWCGRHTEAEGAEGWTTRLYRRLMVPLIHDAPTQRLFLAGVGVLLAGAISLLFLKIVRVKMLPFDNKSEFQVVIDMPEGTTLEETARVGRALGDSLASVPEVTDYQLYVGTASPYNFNGLVRHYFLRRSPHLADMQVNLLPKDARQAQSHDVAKRVRPALQEIARQYGARVKVAEVPPGPPVLQTLVAEVYGPEYRRQIALAREILQRFEQTPGVVDVDWYVEDPYPQYRLIVDKEKAALHGVQSEKLVYLLRIALGGEQVGLLHLPLEKEDVPLLVQLPRAQRSSVADLQALKIAAADGTMVPLAELVHVEEITEPPFIYRKNLKRVVYVTGDVAGEEESPVYAILKLNRALDALPLSEGYRLQRRTALSRVEIERALLAEESRIVAELGLEPWEFRLLCIPFDLYCRLGPARGWGKQRHWTHFDGYQVLRGGRLRALVGGDVRYGGVHDLTSIDRADGRDGVVARFAVVRRARLCAW